MEPVITATENIQAVKYAYAPQSKSLYAGTVV